MFLIASGFVLVFLLSYWISARVGAKRQSAAFGLTAGVISYVVMLALYLVGLTTWARARLIAFMNTEMPMLVEQVMDRVDRVTLIQDTI